MSNMTFPMFFAITSGTWEGLSDGASIIIAVLILIAGILLGYALRGLVGRWKAETIEREMLLKREEADSEIAARLKESDIAARAAVVKAREEFEKSTRERQAELQAMADRITQRETNLDRKAATLDARDQALRDKVDTADQIHAAAKAAEEKALAKNRMADERLQSLSKMTHLEARKEILSRANTALRGDAAILVRRIQEAARETGDTIARQIVADAIQRCAVSHLSELATTVVPLPNAEMKGRIVGRDGRNVRSFEQATGVSLLMDDAPDMVTLSAFDPMRREIARVALTELVKDGRIHPTAIEEAVETARKSVEQMALETGTAAATEAGVSVLSNEILALMGRLQYRTSFSQNVLRHSVEVAILTGTMAGEIGLDVELGRRIGFLHDIGKALSVEKKGAHAALGAEFLKARGESEVVCQAVAAHHAEAGIDGGIYGILCAAADAISSARPGARMETAGDYVQRVFKIEKLAAAHEGVKHAFAVQAGRDLRVAVMPDIISDAAAAELAHDICREISEQVTFPGQIRVTVVREFRCTEYAK